jgi:hypothetical protein
MLIELRKGMTLRPGTFNAVIAPGKMMVSALNSNTDLQRFLFLYVSGNNSRLLSSINRASGNFEIRRAFTAHQLFMTEPAEKHASEAFIAADDPPEAVVFPAPVKTIRRQDQIKSYLREDVDR